jgi:signal transduction histidine kinase
MQRSLAQPSGDLVLATAAHDLRNPLSAIFGYAEALLMEPGEHSLSSRQRELVSRIRGASLRGLELSKNLQALGERHHRLGERRVLSSLVVGANCAVESVWFPSEKELAFSQSISIPGTTRVRLEQYEIERLIGNLLSNAVKFAPHGAKIELKLGIEKNSAKVSVSNTGSAIPLKERAAIFKLFARGSNAHLAPGSGLGLAIVADLVKKAGGNVRVLSSNSGVTFAVLLPTHEAGSYLGETKLKK